MIKLTKWYKEGDYKRYDNYPEAIEVSRVKDIPMNFFGLMGVPITFLDKYDPEQFDILYLNGYDFKGHDGKNLRVNGKYVYSRLIIKHKLAYFKHKN